IADAAALSAVANEETEDETKRWIRDSSSAASDALLEVEIAKLASGDRRAIVRISSEMPTLFMGLAGIETVRLRVTASARRTLDYCVYALDPDSYGSLTVSGS